LDILKNGGSVSLVASTLGRSRASVVCRNCEKWKINNWGWSGEEDQTAVEMLKEGYSCEVISKKIGRSVSAIQSRNSIKWSIDAKGLWSVEEENKIKCLWKEGKTPAEIAFAIGRTEGAVEARKRGWNLNRRGVKHPKTNVEFFRNWSPQSSYVIGFVVTDGNVSGHTRVVSGYECLVYRVKLTQAGDCGKDILTKIQSVSGGAINGPYYPKPVSKGIPQSQWILSWLGKELVDLLASYGIGPRKSFTIEMPPVPDEFFDHFFRGVIDGDGCITNDQQDRPVLSVVSSSEKFLPQLQERLEKFIGIRGSICKVTKKSPASEKRCVSYKLGFSANQSVPIIEWLYKDKEKSFWLKRKFDRYQELQRKQLESI
jgi:hypothetical protein